MRMTALFYVDGVYSMRMTSLFYADDVVLSLPPLLLSPFALSLVVFFLPPCPPLPPRRPSLLTPLGAPCGVWPTLVLRWPPCRSAPASAYRAHYPPSPIYLPNPPQNPSDRPFPCSDSLTPHGTLSGGQAEGWRRDRSPGPFSGPGGGTTAVRLPGHRMATRARGDK